MSDTTTNFGFFVWNLDTDKFDHEELAANWELLDELLLVPPRSVKLVNNLTPGAANGPENPLVDGDTVLTTTTISTFEPYTLLRYGGGSWKTVGGVEIKATVPLAQNWEGRLVLLTASDAPFSDGDLIRNTDGGNLIGSWSLVSPLSAYTTAPGGALNIVGLQATGDMYFSTSGRGPVISDRSNSKKYRLYFSNGGLYGEEVT